MKRENIDFHAVLDEHLAIHERLNAWARWVRVRPTGWQVAPMFRQYRSNHQWEAPVIRVEVNIPEALEMEWAVSLLPEKERAAIRWVYVTGDGPVAAAKRLGLVKQDRADVKALAVLVLSGRTILNRGL